MRLLSHRRVWLWVALPTAFVLFLTVAACVYATSMPGRSYSGPFDPLSEEETAIRDRVKNHVWTLAAKIGERNLEHYEGLNAAMDYVQNEFERSGYEVAVQEYKVSQKWVKNIETEIPGTRLPSQIVLVGAHYDSVLGTAGANDNASGVAALLELARLLKSAPQARTVRFVAFVNEEPPYFQTPDMGSLVYAIRSRQRGENIVAMLSLETIGYYSDEEDSQAHPFPFRALYPTKGNFIGFVGNLSSRGLVRRAIGTFRQTTAFPSEGTAAPGWLTGIDWSDHWSFWQQGYRAMMLTDTAPFRYEHYHEASDRPGQLDYDRLARVISGIRKVIVELADK
jgi:Zn-dependent M28 family amino/carboxypeptidase